MLLQKQYFCGQKKLYKQRLIGYFLMISLLLLLSSFSAVSQKPPEQKISLQNVPGSCLFFPDGKVSVKAQMRTKLSGCLPGW